MIKTIRMSIALLLVFTASLLFSGCDGYGVTPPIAVTFRKSLLDGTTKVLQITNKSGTETLIIRIDAYNDKSGQHQAIAAKVAPGATEEFGFLEMNWYFETGERIEIAADGYLSKIKGYVP